MIFSNKTFSNYSSGTKNFKLKIEDKFKKKSPKDKLHVWPDNYKPFYMPEKSEETYYVKPQKLNYKILLFSILVMLLFWFIELRPIEKNKKESVPVEKSVKVLIIQSSDIKNNTP